jgi:hypothetical protein
MAPRHLLRQVSRNLFGPMIPEQNMVIAIQDADAVSDAIEKCFQQFCINQRLGGQRSFDGPEHGVHIAPADSSSAGLNRP